MPKVYVLDNCHASGRALSVGDVVDLSDNDSVVLRSMGLATNDKDKISAAEKANKKSKSE